jgi:hypothetical protein
LQIAYFRDLSIIKKFWLILNSRKPFHDLAARQRAHDLQPSGLRQGKS